MTGKVPLIMRLSASALLSVDAILNSAVMQQKAGTLMQ